MREGDGVVLVCEVIKKRRKIYIIYILNITTIITAITPPLSPLQATGNPKSFTYSWDLDGGEMAGLVFKYETKRFSFKYLNDW